MTYKCRDGIILTKICDEYLLVAASKCREYCPGVTQVNETAAEIWELLRQGKTTLEIKQYFAENYDIKDINQLDVMISEFMHSMAERGYLIEEGRDQ